MAPNPKYRIAATIRATTGFSIKKIARLLDINHQHLGRVLATPAMQAIISRDVDSLTETMKEEMLASLAQEAKPSLDTLIKIRDNLAVDDNIRANTARYLFDSFMDRAAPKSNGKGAAEGGIHITINADRHSSMASTMAEIGDVEDAEFEDVSNTPSDSTPALPAPSIPVTTIDDFCANFQEEEEAW